MNASRVDQQLADLGIALPSVSVPVGAYTPAVMGGNFVYTSGQLPVVDGVVQITGKVGDGPGLVAPDDAKICARISALNAVSAAKQVLGSLDRVTRVVKLVGFVASDPSFSGQSAVINGASEVVHEIFGEIGVHARSAVGVAALPLDAPVEVELILAYE